MKNINIEEVRNLLLELDPENISFWFNVSYVDIGYSTHSPGEPLICRINPTKHKNEYEEVLTLLHEVLHSHSYFDPYLNNKPHYDPATEKEIDEVAAKILLTEPDIAKCVADKLRQSKSLRIMRPTYRVIY